MSTYNSLPNTLLIHCNTAPRCATARYYGGGRVEIIHLGTITEGGRIRETYGPYVGLHQGHTIDGEPSPCWVWCGNYRKSEPIIRTFYSSYYPRAIMARKVGARGRMSNACGHKNCIRPSHLTLKSFAGHTREMRAKKRPQPRDEKGRFLSPEG